MLVVVLVLDGARVNLEFVKVQMLHELRAAVSRVNNFKNLTIICD